VYVYLRQISYTCINFGPHSTPNPGPAWPLVLPLVTTLLLLSQSDLAHFQSSDHESKPPPVQLVSQGSQVAIPTDTICLQASDKEWTKVT
jgi:hypothetical protein